MSEKEVALDSEDQENDLLSVQALIRQHEGLEVTLINTGLLFYNWFTASFYHALSLTHWPICNVFRATIYFFIPHWQIVFLVWY